MCFFCRLVYNFFYRYEYGSAIMLALLFHGGLIIACVSVAHMAVSSKSAGSTHVKKSINVTEAATINVYVYALPTATSLLSLKKSVALTEPHLLTKRATNILQVKKIKGNEIKKNKTERIDINPAKIKKARLNAVNLKKDSHQGHEQRLLMLLHNAVAHAKYYPENARLFGVTGTSTVAFYLLPDGGIRQPEVIKSSGSAILDKAALAAVRAVSPVRVPQDLLKRAQRFTLQIEFTQR